MKLAAAVLLILTPAWASSASVPVLPAVQSAPVSLSPTNDTFVRSSSTDATQADMSFGNSVYLTCENNSSVMERSYMRFNTTSLAGQTITSALLKIWIIRDNGGGGVDDVFQVYPIFSPWTDALTYTTSATLTQGAMVTSVATTDYPSGSATAPNDTVPPQAVTFDITSLVQSWAGGAANEGLVIRFPTTANADYRFGSNENPDSTLRPVLTVTASGSPTPPPPGPTPPPPGPTPPAAPSGGGSEGDEGFCGALGIEAVLLAGLFGFTRRRRRV